jgi:hypothetical protein
MNKTGDAMTIQTVELAGRKFVIVPQEDFERLREQARRAAGDQDDAAESRRRTKEPGGRALGRQAPRRRLTAQDKGDIAEATRRLNDPKEKPIPYEQVRKELGLA